MSPKGALPNFQNVPGGAKRRSIQLRPAPHWTGNCSYETLIDVRSAINLIKDRNSPVKYSKQIDTEQGITIISTPFLSPSEVKNVLVVKLDHLGDVLLAQPAITRLRERLPDATIWVLCGSWSADLIKRFDSVDQVITFDMFSAMSGDGLTSKSNSEIQQLQHKLLSLNLDIAIDLRRHPETRWILGLTGAPLTIGYESYAYNPTIYLTVDPNKVHISSQLLRLVDAIPILPTGSKKRVLAYRGVLSVGIHPGSGQSAKLWPLQHFSQLVGSLLAAGLKVILFGGPEECDMNQRIIRDHLGNERIIDMSEEISIARYAETVANECQIYVGNDTGPTHMVAIAGVPVIAIYSGVIDPLEWFPPGHIVEVIMKVMPCMPCYIADYRQCPHNLECIASVKPEHIFAKIVSLAREVFRFEVNSTCIGINDKQ